MVVAALALLMFALGGTGEGRRGTTRRGSWRYVVPASGALAAMLLSSFVDLSEVLPGLWLFHSRDGVDRGRTADGDLIWDGLWHSRLSQANDHVGSANWYLAIAAGDRASGSGQRCLGDWPWGRRDRGYHCQIRSETSTSTTSTQGCYSCTGAIRKVRFASRRIPRSRSVGRTRAAVSR